MVEGDVYDDVQKIFYEMRVHVLVSVCMNEIEWQNTGMLMNMQANALKMQGYTNK